MTDPMDGPTDADLRRQWGEELKRRREAADLSQFKLAVKADVGQMSISRMERGVYGGTDATRYKIARALGCEVHEIFAYPPVAEEAS